MKNKSLTKKMKEQLVLAVSNQVMTDDCHKALEAASRIALEAYEQTYGEQKAGLEALPETLVPSVATLTVMVKTENNTAYEREISLSSRVRFAQGMLPPVVGPEIVSILATIEAEKVKTSAIEQTIAEAIEIIPGTQKAIQVWPELLPFIIDLFFQLEEDRNEGVPEEVLKAKADIKSILAEAV